MRDLATRRGRGWVVKWTLCAGLLIALVVGGAWWWRRGASKPSDPSTVVAVIPVDIDGDGVDEVIELSASSTGAVHSVTARDLATRRTRWVNRTESPGLFAGFGPDLAPARHAVTSDRLILVGSPDTRSQPAATPITAYELRTGRLAWRFTIPSDWPKNGRYAALVAHGDVVVAVARDLRTEHLVALDGAAGRVRWELTLDSPSLSAPVVHNGRLIVDGRDGVASIDLASGAVQRIEAMRPAVIAGALFAFRTPGGQLVRVDPPAEAADVVATATLPTHAALTLLGFHRDRLVTAIGDVARKTRLVGVPIAPTARAFDLPLPDGFVLLDEYDWTRFTPASGVLVSEQVRFVPLLLTHLGPDPASGPRSYRLVVVDLELGAFAWMSRSVRDDDHLLDDVANETFQRDGRYIIPWQLPGGSPRQVLLTFDGRTGTFTSASSFVTGPADAQEPISVELLPWLVRGDTIYGHAQLGAWAINLGNPGRPFEPTGPHVVSVVSEVEALLGDLP